MKYTRGMDAFGRMITGIIISLPNHGMSLSIPQTNSLQMYLMRLRKQILICWQNTGSENKTYIYWSLCQVEGSNGEEVQNGD